MSNLQTETFNEMVKEYKEDFLYTDFDGDTEALGKVHCDHEYTQMGGMILAEWMKCVFCGDIKKRSEVK